MIDAAQPPEGIELRDWFAGLAMHALFSNEGSMAVIACGASQDIDPFAAIGASAHRVADGMLDERDAVDVDPEQN